MPAASFLYMCTPREEARVEMRFEVWSLRFSRQWLCCCLPGYDTVYFRQNISTFRRSMLLPLSGKKSIPNLCSSTQRRTQNFFFAGRSAWPSGYTWFMFDFKSFITRIVPNFPNRQPDRLKKKWKLSVYDVFSHTQLTPLLMFITWQLVCTSSIDQHQANAQEHECIQSLYLMVFSFCTYSGSCTLALWWWWPELQVKTGCQIINISKRASCVWPKTSLCFWMPTPTGILRCVIPVVCRKD